MQRWVHVNYAGEFELRQLAMGIDWMTNDELVLAIPPAYTEWIGGQLRLHIGWSGEQLEMASLGQ